MKIMFLLSTIFLCSCFELYDEESEKEPGVYIIDDNCELGKIEINQAEIISLLNELRPPNLSINVEICKESPSIRFYGKNNADSLDLTLLNDSLFEPFEILSLTSNPVLVESSLNLSQWSGLRELYVSGTTLKELPQRSKIPFSVFRIFASNNQITHISQEWLNDPYY